MQHSNRQLERESEYARKNREYLDEKRAQLKALDAEKVDEPVPDKKVIGRYYCCLAIAVILILAIGLIYYFVVNIKESVYSDYLKGKSGLEKILPQGQDEVKKSLDQGQDLFDKTKTQVEDAQKKYDETKETYDKAKDVYEKVSDIVK